MNFRRPLKVKSLLPEELCLKLASLSSDGAGSPSQLRGNLCNKSIVKKEARVPYRRTGNPFIRKKMCYSCETNLCFEENSLIVECVCS